MIKQLHLPPGFFLVSTLITVLYLLSGLTKADTEPEMMTLTPYSLSAMKYGLLLKKLTQNAARYPTRSSSKGEEGIVELLVIINRDGSVKNVDIVNKSRFSRLNKAARDAVKRANPYPEVPEHIPDTEYQFRVAMTFHLQ